MQKRYIFYIILIAFLTYAFYEIICIYFFKVSFGLPLDDVYIHLRYAKNFAAGHIFQYNKGDPLPGSTSPLWVILLSVFYLFSNNGILFSKILSAVFHLLSTLGLFYITLYIIEHLKISEHSRKLNILIAFFVSTVFIFSGRALWSGLSGMETMMFSFLLVVSTYYHIKFLNEYNLYITEFIALGLLSATRPEGYLISLIFFLDLFFSCFSVKERGIPLKKIITGLSIFLLISLPYPLFSYFTTGSVFPTTFYAVKIMSYENQSLEYIKIMSAYLFRDNLFAAVFYFANIFFVLFNFKKYFKELSLLRIINLIIILFPVLSALVFPIWRHHGRYLIPIIPLIIFNSFITGLFIFEKLKFSLLKKKIILLYALIFIFFSIPYFLVFAKHYSQNTDNINEMQVKAGHWIRSNIKNDVRIGLNDIGAIAYTSDMKITDMFGIVTLDMVKFRELNYNEKADSIYNYLKRSDTKYICIFDEWNTELTGKYGDKLKLIETFAIPNNITCGSDKMLLYKIIY
ncbi:MAG: hypothetical protein JW917_00965 [Ignavibacteria bacterium]|nr:hypothetical protein [Ignavibacteria bacterium]